MKNLLTIALLIVSSALLGQSKRVDTIPQVIYANSGDYAEPAYFINGKLVSKSILTTLNPSIIDNISVLDGNIKIDNISYHGQILIKTKDNYNPNIISLNELEKKYTKLKTEPAIFIIDGNIVNSNYDKYLVDQNNLLQIIVTKIDNTNQNINVSVINLLTKTKDNIKKSQQIYIKGKEAVFNQ